jgi:protein-L-isoaspartate(D-aspartate) O-methyltransferase
VESAAAIRDEDAAARKLRMALVDELRGNGSVRSAAVEAAMRAVPRHVFLPEVPLERAYANDAVVLDHNRSKQSVIIGELLADTRL